MTNIISKNSKLWVGILLLASILFSTSCSSDKVSWEDNDHRDIWLRIVPMKLVLEGKAGTKDIFLDMAPSFDVKDVKFELAEDGKEWCSIHREGNNIKVTATKNVPEEGEEPAVRETTIYFTLGDKTTEAKVIQELGAAWVITTSWPYAADGQTGLPEHMIDRKFYDETIPGSEKTDDTFFSILKPGKGAPEAPLTECFFIVDVGVEAEMSSFKIRYRTGQPSVNLRVKTGTFYGSNDGETFEPITGPLTFDETVAENEFILKDVGLAKEDVTYRYIKFTYDSWNSGGNTMQIAEFYIGGVEL